MSHIELESIKDGFQKIKEIALILKEYFMIYKNNYEKITYQINNSFTTPKNETAYNDFIKSLPELEIEIKNIIIEIDRIVDTINLENVSPHYLRFLINEVVNFRWNNIHYINRTYIEYVEDFIEKLDKDDFIYKELDYRAIDALSYISMRYDEYLSTLQDKISSIEIFNKIKDIESHIVLIGANGSGKSTFARSLKGKLSDSTTILSAQHLLIYTSPDMISRNNKELESVYHFQENDKLGSDPNLINFFKDDLNNLVSALLKENADIAVDIDKGKKLENKSILKSVIDIWESLIINRKLKYKSDSIEVSTLEGEKYDFNCLSDGEKTIFYYAAHILFAKKNSYIIVDEPNTHLHPTICNKLWDILEQKRSDCKFIYITHDLDFATSRNDKVLLWNKKFEAPHTWEVERLEPNESIPERLLMEIVGSKQEILFCEGDNKTSLDYKLYSILFKEFTIIPVGGHLNVINYCRAYNKNKNIYGQKSIGIIDGDCNNENQIEKWNKDGIYTLETNEIENLLLDEIILEYASKQFLCEEDIIEKFKQKFFKELEKNKEHQSIWYANNNVNNLLKSNMLSEQKDLEKLKLEFKYIVDENLIQESYNNRLAKLKEYIKQQNYEDALKIANFKGQLIGHFSKLIVDNYKERIMTLISKDTELQEKIYNKYFYMVVR